MNRKLLAITLLLGLSGTPLAYEIGTHALVTQTAVSRSVLSPTHPKSIVPVLGFERLDAIKPFEIALVPAEIQFQGYFDNAPLFAICMRFGPSANRCLWSPPC